MDNELTGTVMTITIVGLGPGNPDQMTLEAWKTLQNAGLVLLWSETHMPLSALPAGPEYRLLADDLADVADRTGQAERIAQAVLAAADQAVVYAVPGSPGLFDESVERVVTLAAERGLACRTISGMSLLEPVIAALGLVGIHDMQIASAAALVDTYHPPLNPDHPALLTLVHSAPVAARLTHTLLNQYPPDHPVHVVQHAGTGRQQVEQRPLQALADSPLIGPAAVVYLPRHSHRGSFESLQEVMAHLRSPEGCPWDREQDHLTLRPYLLEETYEVLEALDRGDLHGLAEELGDLLLQVVFHVQVAVDAGEFRMTDVIEHITDKLVRRHPHVWGDVDVNDSGEVTRNWEAIKKQERRDNGKARASLLDGVSKALPALAQAYHYQERAARVGFDWEQIEPVIDKIREEIDEIQAAEDPDHRAREIGDLLFALVNWVRWMDVEPETALREANQRFYRRFHYIEQAADAAGRALASMTLQEMDALWDEAKARGL